MGLAEVVAGAAQGPEGLVVDGAGSVAGWALLPAET